VIEDASLLAARELGRRASRLTNVVVLLFVLGGVVAAVALFTLFLDWQFRWLGEAELSITVGAAAIVGVGGSVLLARYARLALLRVRGPAWINELAGYHSELRKELEEIASLWR
jgi:hypothetical protein